MIEEQDERGRKRKRRQIFPRYHQLDLVRRLLEDARRQRRGEAVPDPALGRERQEQLDRLAGASARGERRGDDPGVVRAVLPHDDTERGDGPEQAADLKADLDGYQVYGASDVERLVELYLAGADRDRLDPILDRCVEVYLQELDEDGQVDFKGKAKAFIRTYGFLATILPYGSAEWEKLSIFLNFLVPKLPAPKEEDLSKGILEAIDMDSYRVEVRAAMAIALPDENAEVGPVPTSGGGSQLELELERLSAIVREFNERYGGIEWGDADKVRQVITEELPGAGERERGVQERPGAVGPAERTDRERSSGASGDVQAAGDAHGAVQAVLGRPFVPSVGGGRGVPGELGGARHRVATRRGGGRCSGAVA